MIYIIYYTKHKLVTALTKISSQINFMKHISERVSMCGQKVIIA